MKRSNPSKEEIIIGMGATIYNGSDSEPATVIQVTNNGKKVVLQEDLSTRVDNNGVSEIQDYTYQNDPNGAIHIATLRKNGRYCLVGSKIAISFGIRRKYYDYSF